MIGSLVDKCGMMVEQFQQFPVEHEHIQNLRSRLIQGEQHHQYAILSFRLQKNA
jgi:hypothetical protein